MDLTEKTVVEGFEHLNYRLQKPGFSFQHDDYILLQDHMPEIVRMLKMNRKEESDEA